jgi:hypothetical protein
MSEVLQATDKLDVSTQISDLDYSESVDALIAGNLDVAIFPSQLDGNLLQRALNAPGIMLMRVSQAEAIAKMIPGLKHVVLWRGLISLSRDLPSSDIDLLAFPRQGPRAKRSPSCVAVFATGSNARSPLGTGSIQPAR